MKITSKKDTNNFSSLSTYYKSISNYPQLTREQSVELFKQYKSGNQKAKDKLIQSNLRLVISIANNFIKTGIAFEDLVQEGNIGLIQSIDKYDYTKGWRFSTYATWWIRQVIGQHITKRKRTVRVPVHAVGVQKRMHSAIEEFRKEFDCDPTTEEISTLIGASENIVKAAMYNKSSISLSDPAYSSNEDAGTVGDYIADESFFSNPFNVVAQKEIVNVARKSMDKLSKKEMAILRLRYGISEEPTNHKQFPITKNEYEAIIAARKGVK